MARHYLTIVDPCCFAARFANFVCKQAHVRTVLVVSMLKEEELIGIFGIEREEVKPFTEKQIQL